jgi:hypothetical protein
LFNVATNFHVADINPLFDGDYEFDPSELFSIGMDHFNNNPQLYEDLEEWEQRLAYARYNSAGVIVGWDYADLDFCPLKGEYDSITWMYAG